MRGDEYQYPCQHEIRKIREEFDDEEIILRTKSYSRALKPEHAGDGKAIGPALSKETQPQTFGPGGPQDKTVFRYSDLSIQEMLLRYTARTLTTPTMNTG